MRDFEGLLGHRARPSSLGSSIDALMESKGPVYKSHWDAWKDKDVPDVNLPMERYLQEVALETCCLGMLADIMQSMDMVDPVLKILRLEILLKAEHEGFTLQQLNAMKRESLIDHHRVFPHPPELEQALREGGFFG